jgi:hypothetical protein
MAREHKIALWIDSSESSKRALEAIQASGLLFDYYDVAEPNVYADGQPPLLTTPEGTFSGLESILAYVKIPPNTRRWMHRRQASSPA